MNDLTLAATIAGCLAGLALIGGVVVRVFRMAVLAQRAWELLERELSPNGGGSTYDRVRQTQHALRNLQLMLELHLRDPHAHSREVA